VGRQVEHKQDETLNVRGTGGRVSTVRTCAERHMEITRGIINLFSGVLSITEV
jgi:hypothetical protein